MKYQADCYIIILVVFHNDLFLSNFEFEQLLSEEKHYLRTMLKHVNVFFKLLSSFLFQILMNEFIADKFTW